MAHGGRLYRRLFRKGEFVGYDGGDRAAPRPLPVGRRASADRRETLPVAGGGLSAGPCGDGRLAKDGGGIYWWVVYTKEVAYIESYV
jgi:hypothetical protein